MSKQRDIYQKKRRVLDRYLRELLDDSSSKDVERVYLFGSMVWGEPHKDSDIDLLILGDPASVEKRAMDLSYDLMLEEGELVEPMVYSGKEYRYPKSPIVMKAILDGQQLYAR